MSVAAELAALLPPLTFGADPLVISGVLAPVYELGGDAFDYSVDADTAHIAHIAIFDAMGHGLEAGLLASVAMATCRNSRRAGSTWPAPQRPSKSLSPRISVPSVS